MTTTPRSEDLLREMAPQVLGALVRRYGHFDSAEDAVQEALIAASTQWRENGMPDNPRSWLITVASRRLTDQLRGDTARRKREETAVALTAPLAPGRPQNGDADSADDDTLALLLLCCHPALSPASQIALTLRAVGGLTTAQIAGAFLVPESTMAQRISRAKASIKRAGAEFRMPAQVEAERLNATLHVLYLIFNEGYTATSGEALRSAELTDEAIRVTRMVHRRLPHDGEVTGLLALMLLTEARSAARTLADGSLVPLAEQDRSLWDRERIREGVALISDSLARNRLGPYQLQAAIAAVHDEAPAAAATDWPQILALYDLLTRFDESPMVVLNRAVAVAMVDGADAGLRALDSIAEDARITEHHRWLAIRGHLLELAGDFTAARSAYTEAANRTTSIPEKRYLSAKSRGVAN